MSQSTPRLDVLVLPAAREAWLRLAELLEAARPVPCQVGDAEAWWPTRQTLDSPATRDAIAACSTCPARDACLAYAVAADEPEGVWGGLLRHDRRGMGRAAA